MSTEPTGTNTGNFTSMGGETKNLVYDMSRFCKAFFSFFGKDVPDDYGIVDAHIKWIEI